MHPSAGILAALILLILSLTTPAAAQEWEQYIYIDDGFSVLFPVTPEIENFTWTSEVRYELPARTYLATRGQERYSATVVDYRSLEQQGIERAQGCPAGAETCIGGNGSPSSTTGAGYWKMDSRGAMTFAVKKLLTRPGVTISDLSFQFVSVVSSYAVHLVNADQSRTYASVSMHENRLYIFEATVPENGPVPLLFQTSGGFVDEKGRGIRYVDYYVNGVHGLRQSPRPGYRAGGVNFGTPPPDSVRPPAAP